MKLPVLIRHNLRLKLFSLVIASLLWVTIHLATKRQSRRPAPPSPPTTNQVTAQHGLS